MLVIRGVIETPSSITSHEGPPIQRFKLNAPYTVVQQAVHMLAMYKKDSKLFLGLTQHGVAHVSVTSQLKFCRLPHRVPILGNN